MDRIADIARVFAELREAATVEKLLRELLTESEAERLSLRWDIVRFLSEGKSQRMVAQQLGVSLCKVTRGARELKNKKSALREVLERQTPPFQNKPKGKPHANQSVLDRR